MAKTVTIVDNSGRLVDAKGVEQESSARYRKFAERLIGAGSDIAIINYGWNGAKDLSISCNGDFGNSITLKADSVFVPGDLKIGPDKIPLQDLIDDSVAIALPEIRGTPHQIDIGMEELYDSDSSSEEYPRKTYTVKLSKEVLDRISELEDTVNGLFRFDELYRIGDGLEAVKEDRNLLRVKLGEGLKFTEESSSESSEETAAITLDFDSTPTEGSNKPVTSDGIFKAIRSVPYVNPYYIDLDDDGNMVLYKNEE